MIFFKNYIIFLSVIFLPITGIYSQDKIIDSLKNELSTHVEKDTIRVDLLNSLAYNYRRHDITSAEQKSTEANELAKELNYKKGLAKSILIYSKIHISKSEYNEALEDALMSLKIFQNLNYNHHKDVIATYNTLGMISNYRNNPDQSIKYFKKALNLAIQTKELRSQSDMLNNIGITYYSKGELDTAIAFYQKAIATYEAMGNSKRTLSTLNNIAIIYSIQGQYSEALEYYNKILSIYIKDNNKEDIASTNQNMGIIYSEIDQHKKALLYFKKALSIYRELKQQINIAKSLNSIGGSYIQLKQLKKGLEYLDESLIINKKINNNESLIASYGSIGSTYLLLQQPKLALHNFQLSLELSAKDKRNLGSSSINLAEAYLTLKNYDKALQHSIKGKQIVDSLGMLSEQKQVNQILSEIYEAKGDLKKSLSHFKLYKTLNDSLFNKENIEKITQLEYEYKYKQKLESANKRELKLTKKVEITSNDLEKSQHNLLLGVIAFLSITIILGIIIFFLRVRNVKATTQNIIVEQKLLRSQMTPHFIFNALSVLQGIILNKEDKKAVSYLSKFSKLLRITLENSRDQMVSLNNELIAIENYIALQNIEVTEPYNYTITVDSNIDKDLFQIPPMLIQPFIENAIEHGFINQKKNKQIDILLKFINNELICTIIDNGIGINSQKAIKDQRKKSLSTAITSERLEILSKDSKNKGSIHIEDRKKYNQQGTHITLRLPYRINNI